MMSPIVERAFYEGITSIGQLTKQEKAQLNRAVKAGTIQKGKGGPFPNLKTVYCHVARDINEERQLALRILGVVR